MTKAEIVKRLKEEAGLTSLAQAENAYNTMFSLLGNALKNGDSIAISGFGCWVQENASCGSVWFSTLFLGAQIGIHLVDIGAGERFIPIPARLEKAGELGINHNFFLPILAGQHNIQRHMGQIVLSIV